MSIFKTYAPQYFARGMSVIPLIENSKRPVPNAWSDYADFPVPQDIQNYWINMPAPHNIGLVLGKQSNVSVLDFDYDDPALIAKMVAILPEGANIWKRVGKKGFVLAFRFNPEIRSFRIKSKEEGMIVEYLSSGTQVVLPPSIHPDTMRPYESNCDLLEVVDQLVMLSSDIEDQLREIIEFHGITLNTRGMGSVVDHIPAGFRDSAITERAGLFAYEVARGKMSLKRAIENLHAIEASFVEQVAGDAMDMDKHTRNLIKFITNDLKKRNLALPIGWDEGLSAEDVEKLGLTEFEEEWSYQRIIDNYALEVDNSRDSMAAVNFAVTKLAQISNVDNIYEAEALNKIIEKSSYTLKLQDLKRQLSKVRQDNISKIQVDQVEVDLNTHTEVALAAIDGLSHINPVSVENGFFYRWMGSHWAHLHGNELRAFIARQFSNVPLMKRNSDIEGVYKQMLILAPQGLRKDYRQFVNVANGIMLEDGKFLEHHPDFGATYVLPYRYLNYSQPFDMHVNMPLFTGFLRDCWGKRKDFEDLLKALQEALCATFMGYATKYQRAFLLYGLARTGKSVLLEVISSLFPEEAKSSVAFSKMTDNQMLVSLNKKLINIVGELSEKARIEGDVFKAVIDGSGMSARQLYQEAFNMRPIAAHWAASNHLPKTADTSEGFTRRWLIFTFDKQVDPDKVDIRLASKIIQEEREAIFAWALSALPRIQNASGYTLPNSHKKALSMLACQTNPVLFFLLKDHALEFGEQFECTEADLHARFRQFYRIKVASRRNIDMQEFRAMLTEGLHTHSLVPFTKPNDLNNYYRGIRVSPLTVD